MKRIIIITLIFGWVVKIDAQVPTYTFEKGKVFEKYRGFQITKNNIPEKKMPVFDVTPLLEEDKAVEGLDIPFRFGKSFDVDLNLKDGKWVKTDSAEIWSLKISSLKAYSLNFIFSELFLPHGANLYIFNEDGSMIHGPITEEQNQHGKYYLTDIIQGESAVIQLSVPIMAREKPKLTIQKVVHGYRNIFSNNDLEIYGESGDCVKDEDIVCYPAWSEESDGVVQILLANGNELCSGSLLNNTAQDYRPFILTAFHCIDIGVDTAYQSGYLDQNELNQAEDWLVRCRFRHTTCPGSTIANGYTYDDTHFRAAWHPTDFALVELVDDIYRDIYSVGQKVWLGWDRTGNTPSTATCIHHPAGDVMKYTYDGESPSITNYGGTNNSHWLVDDWDIGNTESGSSGSPLFDQNERVIGQDHAGDGEPDCDEDKGTYFGRFSLSWTGDSTNSGRLSNWLQPTGTATTLNSIRQPTPQYSGGADALCSNTWFSVTSLAPGYSIDHWEGNNVTFPSGNTGNPVLVTPGSQGVAWIQGIINTGAGNYTMPRKYFWIGVPEINNIVLSGENYICPDDYNTITAYSNIEMVITDYVWDFPSGFSIISGQGTNSVTFYAPSGFDYSDELVLEISNACGYEDDVFQFYEGYDCGGYFMMMNPNPAAGETTITIGYKENSDLSGENIEWELEVYDNVQTLKEKRTKLKGNSTKLQTSRWKEGVYVVRVKYKDEVLTGKLVVKK